MDELLPVDALTSVFLRRDALAAGYRDRDIAHRVRSGAWHRLRRGAYVDADVWLAASVSDRHALLVRAAVRQAKAEVVASHVSALPEYGAPLWGLRLDVVHLTRTDQRAGRREAGIQQHAGRLEKEDVVERRGISVTSATKTALDITTLTDTETALAVMNHLLHSRATTLDQLRERYDAMAHDPFTLRTDLVLRLADPRIESVGESRSFHLFWKAGLPIPVPQFVVRGIDGEIIARLDFAWPELKAWVEFDGKVKYGGDVGETSDALFREKRREDLVREMTGWRCLRLTWADLEDPVRTAARIRAFLFAAA